MSTEETYLNTDYKTAKARGVIAPDFFAHAAIKTAKYEETIAWFKSVFNMEVMFKSSLACFLTYDEDHHRIAILHLPHLKELPSDCVGVDHLSFTYKSIEELSHTYYRLKKLDINPFWTILHGPTLSMYYKTPDGGNIELQIDVFSSEKECLEWFTEGHYDENPIGIKVDLEDIFEKYSAGTPLSELLIRRKLHPGESFMEHVVM
jgi:catechol-2,3-dioxygenase